MDKKARQVEKVRNFGYNYGTRMHMNDPKPYTRTEAVCDIVESDYDPEKLLATVEALERAEKERDEALKRAATAEWKAHEGNQCLIGLEPDGGFPCGECLPCVRRQRDEARRELVSVNQSRDHLEALLAEREERVRRLEKECDALASEVADRYDAKRAMGNAQAERDALKAEVERLKKPLREMVEVGCEHYDMDMGEIGADALQRAREALGEVE